jgi:hypothetical protein
MTLYHHPCRVATYLVQAQRISGFKGNCVAKPGVGIRAARGAFAGAAAEATRASHGSQKSTGFPLAERKRYGGKCAARGAFGRPRSFCGGLGSRDAPIEFTSVNHRPTGVKRSPCFLES